MCALREAIQPGQRRAVVCHSRTRRAEVQAERFAPLGKPHVLVNGDMRRPAAFEPRSGSNSWQRFSQVEEEGKSLVPRRGAPDGFEHAVISSRLEVGADDRKAGAKRHCRSGRRGGFATANPSNGAEAAK